MRERVASLVGGVSRAMWVMTFHSACARILRADADRLGYKRAFTIYDEADSVRMVKRCMRGARASTRSGTRRARSRRRSRRPRTSSSTPPTTPTRRVDCEEAVADVYRLYERRMVEASAMDFDDLLVRTVNLLELFADVRDKYRRMFRWVLVDEYQDTNRAQYRMLQLLTEEHRNLTVVGDDFQAVYSFRGADIRNILEFERDFPDAETVLLEQNYRSTQTILDAANGLIAHNESQKAKHLWTEGAAGRADRRRRARRRARRGPLRRLRGQPAGRGGDAARRDRGLLPDERPEPGARGHAGALRDPLPGDRRDQVLRPSRDQGRGRLPAAARQPGRRGLVLAGGQLAAARDRPAVRGPAVARTRTRSAATSGTCSRTPRACRGWARPRGRRSARFGETMAALRQRSRSRRVGRRAARGGPSRERLHRRARGRAHGRGRGADREPRGAGRRRGGVRRQPPARGRVGVHAPGGVPRPDLVGLRAGQPARGARAWRR